MLEFKDIELEDKVWVDELLSYSDFRGAEYCFTTLFAWSKIYKTEIGRYKDFLLIRSKSERGYNYIYPAGRGDLNGLIALMVEDSEGLQPKFALMSIPEDKQGFLDSLYPDRFELSSNRDVYDYIYDCSALISLVGKKYQSKRNFIARFKELDSWNYEPVTEDNIADCLAMNEEWCIENGCSQNPSMVEESCAVRRMLFNFSTLKLKGGMLRLGGKVVAYTIGEKINSDTFIVHVEKAFASIKGAYPMINREFLAHEASNLTYVNREDDTGDEGLRRAKLSYNPLFLIEKYCAIEK